jgi:hypothetical protein
MKIPTLGYFTAAILLSGLGLAASDAAPAEDGPALFKRIPVSDQFYAEGAAIGDFNKDGKMDVAIGPFWYEGPDFQKKHQFAAEDFMAKPSDPHNYSKNFLAFTHDFNGDGWTDILIVGFPGEETAWYENPQGKDGPWKRHVALKVTDNESPSFGDLLGEGHPVLICMSHGEMGYAKPDPKDANKEWTWHPTSPKVASYQKFTHGLGWGEVNGDGKMDLLDKDGWYEQPTSLEGDPHWKRHPAHFGDGGAQMLVCDVNGDGLPDVITSIRAHEYGLAWFEQKKGADGGEPTFEKHLIMGETPAENRYGVKFSQMHALALADMDGDGLMDIVTGKRFWAHGPGGDKEPGAPAVLYIFRLVRGKDASGNTTVDFVPYRVDDNSGVGTQVTVGKISGGSLPDIVVGNKKGGFVFINQIDKLGRDSLDRVAPKPVAEAK